MQTTPAQSERTLRTLGYRLSWRYQYSTGPGSGYSEKHLTAPDGVITGSAVGPSGELIVFVAPPDDPQNRLATFPSDCPSPTP